MNSKATLLAALGAALLAGCGGIDSPDRTLSTGQIAGQFTNAKANAYVYVFGHPEIRAQVDGDGSFKLDKVPVGNGKAQLVAFDGDVRADLVDVDVLPAQRKEKDVNADEMPLAGSIVAAVRCTGGQRCDDANYTVDGTEFQGRGGGQVVTLFPLPAGHTYTVQTKLKGFKGAQRPIQVDEGASAEVELDMDTDEGDQARGCVSTGCSEARECDHDDGRCYECNSSSDCKDPAFPHCEEHLCVPNDNVLRSACLPCTSDAQCANGTYATATTGTQPGMCISSGGSRVCSYGCDPANLDADCPSGFQCADGAGTGGAPACVALAACSTVLQAFGTLCLDDATCSTALADAKCFGLVKVKDKPLAPGYCTSRCTTNSDCPTALGFRCDATQLLCVR